MERLQIILLVCAFLMLASALWIVAQTPPALQYEVTIYDAYPGQFWLMIVAGNICLISVLLLSAGTVRHSPKLILGAVAGVLMTGSALLLLPYFRGYYLGFGPSWDALTHIGKMKYILYFG